MAFVPYAASVLLMVAAFGLGYWLKRHPGHPVLDAIDEAMMEAVKNAKLTQAANVLHSLGVFPASATQTGTAPAPASQPPAVATK